MRRLLSFVDATGLTAVAGGQPVGAGACAAKFADLDLSELMRDESVSEIDEVASTFTDDARRSRGGG